MGVWGREKQFMGIRETEYKGVSEWGRDWFERVLLCPFKGNRLEAQTTCSGNAGLVMARKISRGQMIRLLFPPTHTQPGLYYPAVF